MEFLFYLLFHLSISSFKSTSVIQIHDSFFYYSCGLFFIV